ncbi:cytochrome P450/nitrite reductase/ring-hydroxylating ferredoxin subunit [Rhodoblastus acidophilus]|uniref:cytochrome P450 n=1 Tax=Rhodoblastus acidophilus TaxID=1074 RepID=UPI002224F686|nr:cytochrome P450 [Rhodoblastus acidophilus]MCW2317389.1 cytochrome P450/nitrite reductase/ring-hydroxylating ferredoxin subunit [Rhodoblastus acidophilus]
MEPASFARVAPVNELVGAGPFALSVGGRDLAVLRTPDGWRAFEGRCPHLGALLGEGEIDDGHLVCRNHRWRFDVASGRRAGGPELLASCPIVERDGALFADVSALGDCAGSKPAARKLHELPGPRPLPFLGNLHQLEPQSIHLVLEGWAARYGSVYRFALGRARAVAVSDPRLIDHVLRRRPETFRRPASLDRILAEIGVRGVFNAEGDSWRLQRKLTVAALSQRHLRQVYPHIQTVARRLRTRWRRLALESASFDMVEELKRFTVDVTVLVVFGHDLNTLEREESEIHEHLAVILPALSRRIFALLPTWRLLRSPGDRRFDRSVAAVHSWLSGLLAAARRRAAGGQNARAPASFLDAMARATDENGRAFSDDVILSNLFTLVLAGEDTTANSTAWAIHLLADHPDWGRQIRAEADSQLGDAAAPEDIDAANALTATNAVANEAMRLKPVGPVILLEANVDTQIGDVEIPSGTLVAALSRPAALDDRHFADGRAFRPQRWLESRTADAGGAHDLGAHLPFGSGPRMCPGRALALVEMNTILAMLYKHFDVERMGAAADVAESFGFVMSPAGLRVRLRLRV